MGDSVLFPSINWYSTTLAVGSDGSALYGAPGKGLAYVKAVFPDENSVINDLTFEVHYQHHLHLDRVTHVDLSPCWPNELKLVTAGKDFQVKEWQVIEGDSDCKFQNLCVHNVFSNTNEEIIGLGYLDSKTVISIGASGSIIKWDLESNVTKRNKTLLAKIKPSCMSCSPHSNNLVAVGSKQGLVVVFNAEDYKFRCTLRGHTDEIYMMSWCPKYSVSVKKETLSALAQRLNNIRSGKVNPRIGTKVINDGTLQDCTNKSAIEADEKKSFNDSQNERKENVSQTNEDEGNESDVSVPEENLFDVYKEPDIEEFGHKKYEPEEITITEKMKNKRNESIDYATECKQLRERIAQMNNSEDEPHCLEETPIATLVDEMSSKLNLTYEDTAESGSSTTNYEGLFACIDRRGKITVWDRTGVLIARSSVFANKIKPGPVATTTIHWMTAESLLTSDSNSQISEGNPLCLDSKDSFYCKPLDTVGQKGLYVMKSSAPRVQEDVSNDDFIVWGSCLNRHVAVFSYKEKKTWMFPSFGSNIYQIVPCPYDALTYALSCGDGTIKLWRLTRDDQGKLVYGKSKTYWDNVSGKVLIIEWHPTKENLLAFGTSEGRVGLIDTCGKGEKPARILKMMLGQPVYTVSWGNGMELYARGGDKFLCYNAQDPAADPIRISVQNEGVNLRICECKWNEKGLAVGTQDGAVAVLAPNLPHNLLAIIYCFSKNLQSIAWKPHSPGFNKCWLAAASTENYIVILNFKGNGTQSVLELVYKLEGHLHSINKVVWSPNQDEVLLSASSDTTIMLWQCEETSYKRIGGAAVNTNAALCASFCTEVPDIIFAGGVDGYLRIFSLEAMKNNDFTPKEKKKKKAAASVKPRVAVAEPELMKKNRSTILKECKVPRNQADVPNEGQKAVMEKNREKYNRNFLFPVFHRAQKKQSAKGLKIMLINSGILQEGEVTLVEEGSGDENFDYLKFYEGPEALTELLELESAQLKKSQWNAWCSLNILRGEIETVIKESAANDHLTPYLLALTPAVSYKFWKDTVPLYMQQCERKGAKGYPEERHESYGGLLLSRALLMLCTDVVAGLAALDALGASKEAYIAAVLRRLPARQYLLNFAYYCIASCAHVTAAECFVALGELSDAARALSHSHNTDHLVLASKISRHLSMTAFADGIDVKVESLKSSNCIEEDPLPHLDTLAEQLANIQCREHNTEAVADGDNENV